MKAIFNFFALTLFGALMLFSCSPEASSDNSTEDVLGNFLSMSDIHFNPLYDSSLSKALIDTDAEHWDTVFATSKIESYGHYGWNGPFYDTGWKLFKSALQEMKKANANPDFITINGDFLAHSFESQFQTIMHSNDTAALHSFIIKTVDYIATSISKEFPNTPIFPTLGNNDSFCGDYEVQTPGSFLTRTAGIWLKNLNGLVDESAYTNSYKKGGYFVTKSPANEKHKIISLNTIMLSVKFMKTQNFCGTTPDSTDNAQSVQAQFAWLENELKKAEANQEKVWLMFHIPPGINAYSSIATKDTTSCGIDPFYYYHPDYNAQYLALIEKYQNTITAQLGGHTHMDNFIVIDGDQTPDSFVHIMPAISPIYYNNPGFLEYTFSENSSIIKDYNVHGFEDVETAKNPNWINEYTFSETYHQNELTPESLKKVYMGFETNAEMKQHYIDYYVVEDTVNTSINNENWAAYFCAFGNQTAESYQDCVCRLTNTK